jgi:hypothetical protein
VLSDPVNFIDPQGKNALLIGGACYAVYKLVTGTDALINITSSALGGLDTCDKKTKGDKSNERYLYCAGNVTVNFIGELALEFLSPVPGIVTPNPHKFGLGN